MTDLMRHLHSLRFDAGLSLLIAMLLGVAAAAILLRRRGRSGRRSIRVKLMEPDESHSD